MFSVYQKVYQNVKNIPSYAIVEIVYRRLMTQAIN